MHFPGSRFPCLAALAALALAASPTLADFRGSDVCDANPSGCIIMEPERRVVRPLRPVLPRHRNHPIGNGFVPRPPDDRDPGAGPSVLFAPILERRPATNRPGIIARIPARPGGGGRFVDLACTGPGGADIELRFPLAGEPSLPEPGPKGLDMAFVFGSKRPLRLPVRLLPAPEAGPGMVSARVGPTFLHALVLVSKVTLEVPGREPAVWRFQVADPDAAAILAACPT